MPKRVYGICPDCGNSVSKRNGKLLTHTMNPKVYVRDGGILCKGQGKRVPTASPGPRKGKWAIFE